MPKAANIDAYSQPTTPPPITIMLLGMASVDRIESESHTVRSLKGMVPGRRGRDPVPITIKSAFNRSMSPFGFMTCRVCASTNEATP